MAELLSSSDEDASPTPSIATFARSSTSTSSSIPTSSFGVTDRSESESDLIHSLLSSSPTVLSQAWKGSAPSQKSYKAVDNGAHDASAVSSQETKKPVVSARDILMKFLPTANQKAHLIGSPPLKNPSTTTTRAANALYSVRDAHSKSPVVERVCASATGSIKCAQQTELSASERIALKHGLLPSDSSPGVRASPASDQSRGRKGMAPSTDKTQEAVESTPTRPGSATQSRERSPFWDLEVGTSAEKKSSATYISPFRSKDGFIDARRRRRSSGEDAGSRSQDPLLSAQAIYDDSQNATTEIGNRPRHVIASSITKASGKSTENGEAESDDDDWMSDAKDIADEQKERAATRVLSVAEDTDEPHNALSAGRGRSRFLKRPRKRRAGSEGDSDVEDTDRWPRLPPSENKEGPFVLRASGSGQSVEVCENINNYLFDYQREGVRFLYNAYSNSTGGILGDEMGLGKTIQVIAFIAAVLGKHGDYRDKESWRSLRSKRREAIASMQGSDQNAALDFTSGPAPILVVVPASLLHNWETELRAWLCCCSVILHGKPDEREAIVNQISSYDILKMTVDRLDKVPWDAVIFDEMHCLKSPESKLTRAVQSMKCAKKLGLTGTLMQNNEKELHCLIDTIAPGVLGTWSEFRSYYGDDIKYGRKKSAVPKAVERSRRKEKQLRQVLTPYYLRREKEINPSFQEIKKCDQVVFCDLTPYQLAAYKRILAMPEFELLRRGEEECDCGRDSKRKRKECCYQTPSSIEDSRPLIWERFHRNGEACSSCPNCMGLVCVAQLLKLSNHMELLKVNPHDPPDMQEYGAEFAAEAFGDDIDAVGGVEQVSSFQEMRSIGTKTCGKMLVLEKLLALWKKRRQKTLLFSRSTRMLDILQLFLISKAITYLRLDGNTKVDDRLRLVNEFNSAESNASVFLLSTKAGGLGLNLPTATNVVIFDPSWNPAHDCQAQDRAYRIGQTKDVQVYRLITLGTIEEMIYVRQIYKQQLSDTTLKGVKAPRYFEGVQGDRNQQGELFGIRNLLCWKEGGVLKGIQDAYRRGNDDLLIQENRIDYSKAQSKSSAHQKAYKRVDEEMVDIADEIVSNIVVQEGDSTAAEQSNTTPRKIADHDGESDTDEYLLNGAKTFMHEAIVGDNQPNPLSQSDSDFEPAGPEQEMHLEQGRKTSKTRRQSSGGGPNQKKLDFKKTPPSKGNTSIIGTTSGSEIEFGKEQPASIQPPSRKGLYIPKYL
ncbi:DNA repair and recombination protein rad26, partial [Globisporangium splendens]